MTKKRVLLVPLFLLSLLACPKQAFHPDSIYQTQLGWEYYKKGYLFEAQKRFQLAVERDNRFSKAYEGLGVVDMRRGLFRSAIRYLKQAVSYDSSNQTAWEALGLSQKNRQLYSEARASLLKALQLNTSLFGARLYLVQVLRQQKDWALASQNVFYLLSHHSTQPEPHFELGMIQLAQNKEREAEKSFLKAVEEKSTFLKAHLQLAQLYLAQKKKNLALQYLQVILAAQPNHIQARKMLGEAQNL